MAKLLLVTNGLFPKVVLYFDRLPVVLFVKLEGKTIAELFVRSVMSMMEFELPIGNLERRKTKNIIDEIKNEIEDLSDCCQPADVYYRSTEQP